MRTVIDGNAFYEIDEECYEKLMKKKDNVGEENRLKRKHQAKDMEKNIRQDKNGGKSEKDTSRNSRR